ncbi:hypothetical protein RJ640_017964 [Escallonia rubra]|uniref:Chlororespiratory reduction 4 n=1 Tax=Escallonia rubra TaxID=112253 RepID=A0AA88UCS1_9ASTE|nr:hypothetical protein RJ640_017964 [Escallonia rubra]
MFKAYIQIESYREVVVLFGQMRSMDVPLNCFTFPIVLKSCGKITALQEGEEVHCLVLKVGFNSNPYVGTTLLDMYSSAGVIGSAYKVFSEISVRNVVAWTSMINGYLLHGDVISARQLFDLAPDRDVVLWNSMVSGYIQCGDIVAARDLFDVMPNRDLMSWNTLLNGYANSGDVEGCEKLFEEMPEKNVFSWNGLIGGYAHHGRFFEVLDAFERMLNETQVLPNDATLVIVLSACSRLGALDMGKRVHIYAESNGYKTNAYVSNGLIDMYAKCGLIDSAINMFQSMGRKDLISWNTMINGLAVHGHGADALSLLSEMKSAGERPDGITFIGILCACSHLGLVKAGFKYFHSMVREYSIVPQIEHYGCMVDLLARAGLLEQAVDFVRWMPIKADSVIWTTLLGACRKHRNIKLAELALQQLIELDPENPSNYVMLSNIYGDAKRWEDVARSKMAMRDTGSRKLPGLSLIEVIGGVVEFYAFDEKHSRKDEIYGALRGLTKLLRSSGYLPDHIEAFDEESM